MNTEIDSFLRDGLRVVPSEFKAWQEAQARYSELFFRSSFADADDGLEDLGEQEFNAKLNAMHLEAKARQAFARKTGNSQNCSGKSRDFSGAILHCNLGISK